MRTIAHRLAALGATAVVVAGTALAALPAHAAGDPVAPISVDDAYTTTVNTPLQVSAPGVLANDIDPDSGMVLYYVDQSGTAGTISFTADGGFLYTPTADFVGTTNFLYRTYDSVTQKTAELASVTIDVEPAAEPQPVSITAHDDLYFAEPGESITVSASWGLLDGDVHSAGGSFEVVQYTEPTAGAFSLLADGAFQWTAPADFCDVLTFTYVAGDGIVVSNVATVTLKASISGAAVECATPDENSAPTAIVDDFSVVPGTTVQIAAPGVLANDSDADGDALSAVGVTAPVAGSGFALDADGGLTWTAPVDFCDVVEFSYLVSDGESESAPATVRFHAVEDATGDRGGISCPEGEEEPTEPTEPSEPVEPTEPTTPTEPSLPELPTAPQPEGEPADGGESGDTEALPDVTLAATPRTQLAVTGAPEQLLVGLGAGALLALLVGGAGLAGGVRRRSAQAR